MGFSCRLVPPVLGKAHQVLAHRSVGIPWELWMSGGFLNETGTQESRNQELSPQKSKTKSFKFSALFF